jgi:TolB-like protein/DNA-binding winged helix-turn-helix (wHTH) protein/Tfp pilus assembly protein PilF
MQGRRIQFGTFELDPAAGELRKHGIRIRLQDQPLQVLQQLLEHPGEVVTKEELQKRIWPADTFVDFDHGLYSAVQRLRDALGDTADTPRYIETLPRRGYRLIATVTNGNGIEQKVVENAEASALVIPEQLPPSGRAYKPILLAAGGILVALLVALAVKGGVLRERWFGSATAPAIQSIAVLPLQNLSSDASQEYFADGLTDALITDLAQIGSLKVISRTSTMRYKKSDKTLPEIARELNVDGIVEGTVQRSGDRVRITAQLIHASTDKHLWANSFERDARDVLPMESEIAEGIAKEIRAKLTAQEQTRIATAQPVNIKAFEDYLQGESHFNKYGRGYNDQELRKAIEYFEQATREDPNFAPAHVKLFQAYDRAAEFERPTETMPRERAAAERALSLDPDSSDAHLALANVKFSYDWDWAGAEEEFKRALQLNPNNANAREEFGDYLQAVGRINEGMIEQQRAQELDPHIDHLSNGFYRSRQYARGIEWLQKQIEIDPQSGVHYIQLTNFYGQQDMQPEYIATMATTARLYGFPQLAESLSRIYANAGYRAAMLKFCSSIEQLQKAGTIWMPGYLADFYTRLGEQEKALRWLEIAYEQHDGSITFLGCDPEWDSIRSTPRFRALIRRLGFPAIPNASNH